MNFSHMAKYRIAKQLSQQSGYDFPLEVRVSDYAGNETSNRGSGPDGPLRIQVPDPYFSPNGDGVKDSLNFNVIAETSEPYFVAIKRNGIGVKTWPNLVGNQSLSWNGNFMFTDELQADGKYQIVAMTEKQRDRVRDAQIVVLDTVGPEMKKLYAKKSSGNVQITAKVADKLAGIDESITPLPIRPQLLNSTTTGFGSYFGKDYFYELQNPFFQPVPDGTLSYRLSATDRAGNTKTVDGDNRAPVIRIVEVEANDDLHLIIKAKIEDQEADIDINSIKLDLEPLGIDVKASSQYYDTSKKLLTLEVTDYLIKIDDSGTHCPPIIFAFKVKKKYCLNFMRPIYWALIRFNHWIKPNRILKWSRGMPMLCVEAIDAVLQP